MNEFAPFLFTIRTANTDIAFDWQEIFTVWKQYALFFVVFLIHNHLLAPMLIYRQRKWLYIGSCLAIIILFHTYQCNHRPNFKEIRKHRIEMMEGKMDRNPFPPDDNFKPDGLHEPDDMHRPDEFFEKGPQRGPRKEHRTPLFFGQHDIISIVILIMMLGMNLGIKLYFRHAGDRA